MTTLIRTCLVDDHKLFCEGLERLLIDSGRFKILGKFHNGHRIIEESPALNPDLLVMDIEMPGGNGLDIIKRIRLNNPQVKIVMLSMHEENAYIQEAYLLGADAYLSKSVESGILIECLLRVCSGERIFPEITLIEKEESPLSHREEEILKLIARGKTSEEVAEILSISPLTVKAHRRNMIRKIKAKNSSELITKAVEKGLL